MLNINNIQVGHVPRNVVTKLAPLLDQGKVTVEGTMLEGNSKSSMPRLSQSSDRLQWEASNILSRCESPTPHPYDVFLDSIRRSVKIYGRMDQRQALEPLLIWATPGQRGFGPSSSQHSNVPATQTRAAPTYSSYHDPYSNVHKPHAPVLTPAQVVAQKKLAEDMKKATELRQILDGLEKVNDEGRRASLLDQLLSTDDVLTLPEHPNPPGIDAGNLTVNLLKHQVPIRRHCGRPKCADIYAETSVTLVH